MNKTYVKIIECPYTEKLENKINIFLENNIDLVDIKYDVTDCYSNGYSALIIYKKTEQSE